MSWWSSMWKPKKGSSKNDPPSKRLTIATPQRKYRGEMETVFADLKQADTANLKHVSKEDRKAAKDSKPVVVAKALEKKEKPKVVGRFEKEGRDWIVEGYTNHLEPLKLEDHKMMESLHIRNCEDAVIEVDKKINQVIVDACSGVVLKIESLISSLEIIHSDRIKIVIGKYVPSVFVDSSDSVNLYVPQSSKEVIVTTSKTAEMNMHVQSEEDEEDWVEVAVPCQFVHEITADLKLKSKVSDAYA